MSMNEEPSNHQSKSLIQKIAELISSEPQDQEALLEIVATAKGKGIITDDTLSTIQGAVHISHMHVREIMIPRSQMAVIKVDDSLNDMLEVITESAHSRFPVVSPDDNSDVLGLLLAKDLLPLVKDNLLSSLDVRELLRPVSFVPESKRLNVLLKEFKDNRNHMAIVLNEYGSPAGLVTIEDVLEQIVGEIEDEHDFEEDFMIKKTDNNQFIVKALTPVEDFNEHFCTEFSEEEFDTIGGIVTHHFGHLPRRNESLLIKSCHFKVLNADHRSIRLLEVTPNH